MPKRRRQVAAERSLPRWRRRRKRDQFDEAAFSQQSQLRRYLPASMSGKPWLCRDMLTGTVTLVWARGVCWSRFCRGCYAGSKRFSPRQGPAAGARLAAKAGDGRCSKPRSGIGKEHGQLGLPERLIRTWPRARALRLDMLIQRAQLGL